jgi:hypothetical protein
VVSGARGVRSFCTSPVLVTGADGGVTARTGKPVVDVQISRMVAA